MLAQRRLPFALLLTAVSALVGAVSSAAAQGPPPSPPPQPPLAQRLQPILRARFPAGGEPPELVAAGGPFPGASGMACFYDRRHYAPAWIGDAGVREEAANLIIALGKAPEDGLDSERYRLADLRQRLAQVEAHPTPGDLAEIDLRLTDAFLRLAADLRYGAVNPELIYDDCEIDIPEVDLPALLESALAAGRVRMTLAALAPTQEAYTKLKDALEGLRWQASTGGWPK